MATLTVSGNIWPIWTSTATPSATTTDVTWGYWVGGIDATTAGTTVIYTGTVWAGWSNNVIETQEQAQARREAQAARYAEQRRKEDEWAEQRKKARETAKALLEMLLDAQQKEQLASKKYFDVISKKGRKYRIRESIAGNVRLLEDSGRESVQLCIHPVSVPEEDAMLAQKLMIETDEDAFLRTANLTRLMTAKEADEIMREAAQLRRVPA